MAVGTDHAAVQTDVAGLDRRDSLQLRRGEIILRDAVLIVQQLHHCQLHPAAVLLVSDGTAADEQVQRLAGHCLTQGLFALLHAQMGQQIRNHQQRITRVRTQIHRHLLAALERHHAPQLQGDRHPLILFDSPVIVGFQQGQLTVLIEGIGLEIQTGRINVRSRNLRAMLQRLPADMGQHHRLTPVAHIHLVAAFELFSPDIGPVARRLCQTHRLRGAQPLGLTGIQERLVRCTVGLHGLQLFLAQPVISVFPAGKQLLFQILDLIRHGWFLLLSSEIFRSSRGAFPPEWPPPSDGRTSGHQPETPLPCRQNWSIHSRICSDSIRRLSVRKSAAGHIVP